LITGSKAIFADLSALGRQTLYDWKKELLAQ
jgi:hypothetical protein